MSEIIVGARGPINARVMLVGERPGEDEARSGRPFVGRAGQEQDRYLFNAGLNPFHIRMTNLCKDYIEGNPDPASADIERWSPTLLKEIETTNPTFIIPVGRFAVRWFLGDVDMEHVHGIAQRWNRGSHVILPCYHPAGGFYDDEARPIIAYDYWRAGQYVSGKLPIEFQEDGCANPTYIEADRPYNFSHESIIAIDTEGTPDNPWSIQTSVEPGTGIVFRRDNKWFDSNIRAIQRAIDDSLDSGSGPIIVLHNAMYDLEMCAVMGLDLFDCHLFDTRYAAYILRVEPQGLKSLAARHCGMKMSSYDEVVGPIGLEKQLSYLARILEVGGWPRPEARAERGNDGTARLYTPQPIERRAEAILIDYYSEKLDKDGNRTDPYERWKQVDRELRKMVEKRLGPMPIGTLADIPLQDAIYYAGRDPDATLRLYHRLVPVLKARNLAQLMQDGNDVLPVFEEMQRNGILADRPYFEQHWEKMDARMAEIQAYISHHFWQGRPFNPNSPPQVQALMRRRGLEGEKRSKKTGKVSTGKKSIEHFRYTDDAIAHIIDWREHEKMRDGFDGPIIERLNEREVDRGRIRTNLNPYKVVSRRVSSSNPNLTAIPVRNELGVEVRDGFFAEEGCYLGSWDLSQIEMRYMAHVSRDPLLVKFLLEGRDPHSETASRIFGIPLRASSHPDPAIRYKEQYADIKEMEHRYPSKRAGFGIITNIQGTGLYDQLRMFGCQGWSVEKCDELIREYLKLYKGVKAFMDQAAQEARDHGFVRDVWGMERPLPGVFSVDRKVVAEAERAASSMKIQGGAQGMIQRSMIWLKPYIRGLQQAGAKVRWVLQIHDEIILEFQKDLWETLNPLVLEGLTEHSLKLIVPVKAKGSYAETWGQLKG